MSTRQIGALATAVAVLSALDRLKSKELFMGTFYSADHNRFCVKGALHDSVAPKSKSLFNEAKKIKAGTFNYDTDNVDVDDILDRYDGNVLDDIESFGFAVRTSDYEAPARKQTFKKVRAYVVALIDMLKAKEQLAKATTFKKHGATRTRTPDILDLLQFSAPEPEPAYSY